jgi:hypothetical protein
LRCRPGGSKTYFLKVRIGNRQRWLTIGRHGAPWTPETARKEALRLLGEVWRARRRALAHRSPPAPAATEGAAAPASRIGRSHCLAMLRPPIRAAGRRISSHCRLALWLTCAGGHNLRHGCCPSPFAIVVGSACPPALCSNARSVARYRGINDGAARYRWGRGIWSLH